LQGSATALRIVPLIAMSKLIVGAGQS